MERHPVPRDKIIETTIRFHQNILDNIAAVEPRGEFAVESHPNQLLQRGAMPVHQIIARGGVTRFRFLE